MRAEDGGVASSGYVAEPFALIGWLFIDDRGGSLDPEAAKEWPLASDGAVDSGAYADVGCACRGLTLGFKPKHGMILSVESGLLKGLADGEPLIALGDPSDNAEEMPRSNVRGERAGEVFSP